jgi:DNA-nicking Smr family endonuclease
MKTGDTVRFLNSIGGGKITRIDEKKGLVYVEDADGFEVPALIREVVVIANVSETTNAPKRDFSSKKAEIPQQPTVVFVEQKIEKEPIVETTEGDKLAVVLAFFPKDIKQLQTTAYECYLVNDSNYFLFYNIVIDENASTSLSDHSARKSVSNGQIEPNIQEFLLEISKENLNNWENLQVQIIAFKKDKIFEQQTVIDIPIKLNVVKFYKLHSFTENDYFDEPSLLVDIIEEKERQKLSEISPKEIKEAIFAKEKSEQKPKQPIPSQKNNIIEVDLHINELLDSTAGMNNTDMLQYQMDKFHATLNENRNKKGQKIVFIHGKGEGVLRKEIETQLKSKYKGYYFQDASFREYGFGATMVTIK